MSQVPSHPSVRLRRRPWTFIAVILAASPLSAQEPIRLPAERVSVAPEFEPENLPYGYEEGDELPAAMLSVGGGATWVGALAYSPDGSSLAVGDRPTRPICTFLAAPPVNENGGLIRVINLATRRVTWTIRPAKKPRHEYEIVGLAYTPDGKSLVAHGKESWPSEDGGREYGYHLTTWDLHTGRIARRIDSTKLDDWELPTFSADVSTFAARTNEGIRAWDVATGRAWPPPEGAPVEPTVLTFSPDGKTLAVRDKGGDAGLWGIASGRRIASLPALVADGKGFEINSLAFSPDSRTLGVMGWRLVPVEPAGLRSVSEVRLIDLATNRERATITCFDPGGFESVAFSPDGKTIATTSADGGESQDLKGFLRFWDAATGKERANGTRIMRSSTLAYARDGSVLMTATTPNSFAIRDPLDGRERFSLPRDWDPRLEREQYAISPDGRTLASGNSTFHLWDLRAAAEPPIRGGHRFEVTCLAYAPDGRTLASASVDRTVKLWDVEARRPRVTLVGHADDVARLAYTPDGRALASVDAQGSVRIWDTTTGACRATLRGPELKPELLAFSPDGRSLILIAWHYGQLAQVRRWDAASGELLPTGDLAANLSAPLAFSPDGGRVVSANKERIEVRDATTGGLRSEFPAKEESLTLFPSLDGETVIQLTQHHSIVIHRRSAGTWRSETLFADDELGIEFGTYVPGLRMTTIPDARILAAKIEGTVQVFDTVKLRPIAEFPDVENNVTWLALSPDGKSLATGRDGGEIIINDLSKVVASALKP